MPTIGTSSKPAYVYDAGTDTWIPIGPGEHTHPYVEKSTLTTTGDLVYASAANTPARLGIGSTDQVLKVSGGLPVWGSSGVNKNFTLANAGGTSLSGSNTVTVSGLDAEEIYIFITGVSSTVASNTKFVLRFNTDSGNSYNTYGGILANLTTYGATILQRINQQWGNPASGLYVGTIGDNVSSVLEVAAHIRGCKSTSPKMYTALSGAQLGDNKMGVWNGGYYTGTSPITSVSVFVNQGNLDDGTMFIYTSS